MFVQKVIKINPADEITPVISGNNAKASFLNFYSYLFRYFLSK